MIAPLAAALLLAPPTAIVDEALAYRLTIPAGWVASATEADDGVDLLRSYRDPRSGQILVVTRMRGNTDGAWDDLPEFFAAVEEGARNDTPAYARLSARARKLGDRKIPAFDLWFTTTREGRKAVVGSRYLFFRGYAVILVLEAPGAARPSRLLRRVVESFTPTR